MPRSDTSIRPASRTGIWTRRPSVVSATTTWRRSRPSNRPNALSRCVSPWSRLRGVAKSISWAATVNQNAEVRLAVGRWSQASHEVPRRDTDATLLTTGGILSPDERRHLPGQVVATPPGRGPFSDIPTAVGFRRPVVRHVAAPSPSPTSSTAIGQIHRSSRSSRDVLVERWQAIAVLHERRPEGVCPSPDEGSSTA